MEEHKTYKGLLEELPDEVVKLCTCFAGHSHWKTCELSCPELVNLIVIFNCIGVLSDELPTLIESPGSAMFVAVSPYWEKLSIGNPHAKVWAGA